MDSKAFNGHIMVQFKFNVFDVFSQHFKVHNAVIFSFKPNEIVIQTMDEDMNGGTNKAMNDVDIKSFYTTTIPIGSLKEYDFDCNFPEVNIMITKSLIKSTSKVAGGCKSINVVSNGFLLINEEIVEPLVEISFDLYERQRRGVKSEFRSEFRNKTNDLILNLTPEKVTQHSRIVTTTRKG